MANKMRFMGVVCAAGVLIFAGCGGGGSSSGGSGDAPKETGPIKLGVPLGFTGPTAAVGDWARMGVELSVKEVNAAGGIDGRQVEAVYVDTQADPTKAVTAVNRLVSQDKVDIIVGPMTSDETLATLPISTKANVASINGSGSAITPQVAPMSFALLMNAEHQAQKMVEVAATKYSAKKIGTLNYSQTQGKVAAEAFNKAIADKGLTKTATEEYDVPVTDLAPQLLKLRASSPDAIVAFVQTGTDAGRIAIGLRELGWDVPVVSSYGSTFAAQAIGVGGPDTFKQIKSVTWSAFSACSASDILPKSAKFIKDVESNFEAKRTERAAFDYVAAYRDALFLLKAGIEGAKSTDGDKVAKWLESDGAKAAPKLPLVHQGYAMSATNHFLMDTSSLTLVDSGEQVEKHIQHRLECS